MMDWNHTHFLFSCIFIKELQRDVIDITKFEMDQNFALRFYNFYTFVLYTYGKTASRSAHPQKGGCQSQGVEWCGVSMS